MPGCDLLITGASGFVGRHVLAQAEQLGLDARPLTGDLRRPETALEAVADAAPRAVLHLASAARASRGSAWAAMRDDVVMLASVVEAVSVHAPAARLVAIGSAAQYGAGSPGLLRESDPTVPISPYGQTKCLLETALLSPAMAGDLQVVWARSFNHLGPGQPVDAPVAGWAQQVAAAEAAGGGELRTGRLDVVRDFLDVRDAASAYLSLVRSDAVGVVNVCSGVAVRLADLAAALVERSTAPITLVEDPALHRAGDPVRVVGDPTRLRTATSWSPSIPLERSVDDVLAEHRAARGAPDRAVEG